MATNFPLLAAGALIGAAAASFAQTQSPPPPPTPTQAPPPAHAPEAPPPEPALTVAQPAEPDPDTLPDAVVLLQSGQKLSGKLVERNAAHVVLLVGNIKMDLDAAQVSAVEVQPSIAERYQEARRMISPKDLPQRLYLVRWLIEKEKYDWALKEVEGVLDEDPANPDAQSLRRLIVGQIDLRQRSGRPAPERRPPPDHPPKFQFPLLTAPQISLIKIYETDLADPPRLSVPRQAIDKLLAEYAGSDLLPPTKEGKDALYHQPPVEVLALMFRLHARDLYGMVQVQDQPRSIERFRDNVQQTWLMNTCATDRCHGGAQAGRLWLYNKRPNGDPALYTDFLILDRFRTADDHPLINYAEPARSPLLQMALPRENSLSPHPKVPGSNGRGDAWKPAFSSPDDKRFAQAVEWIKSMYQPRPDYPVDYDPPAPSAPQTNAAAPAQGR